MQHLVYSVRYSVVLINSSLLTITVDFSVRKTLGQSDTKYPLLFVALLPSSTVLTVPKDQNFFFFQILINLIRLSVCNRRNYRPNIVNADSAMLLKLSFIGMSSDVTSSKHI
jgi:hypothetical protein